MISLPFRRSSRGASIDALYGMIVAQARNVEFYRGYGVPDTVDGRLDMIVLHLVLVLRQMTRAQGSLPPAGQQLFDHFCADMDSNFREMGVGDFGVPKRMQKVGEAFYGRAKVYESALVDADPAVLDAAVARNVFGAAETPLGARRLAAYMRGTADRLAALAADALIATKFEFPDPASVATPAGREALEQH
jgi:cytochrome b pre-mRNA-processing protein 3